MRGLNKLYWLKIEIEDTEKKIAEIEREIASLPIISSPQITGMPHGTDVSNPIEKYYLKKEALKEVLMQRQNILMDKKKELREEEIRLTGIIERIEDPAIKKMATMRFIDCKRWEDIAEATNYDRSVCYRKVKKYIDAMTI